MDSFWVIGIAARTTNAREEGPDGIIPNQWQRFFQQGVADKIPNRIGNDIYAVYTTCASDHNGEYTYLIGVKVEHGTAPPAGMVVVDVPAGSYAVLTSDKRTTPAGGTCSVEEDLPIRGWRKNSSSL